MYYAGLQAKLALSCLMILVVVTHALNIETTTTIAQSSSLSIHELLSKIYKANRAQSLLEVPVSWIGEDGAVKKGVLSGSRTGLTLDGKALQPTHMRDLIDSEVSIFKAPSLESTIDRGFAIKSGKWLSFLVSDDARPIMWEILQLSSILQWGVNVERKSTELAVTNIVAAFKFAKYPLAVFPYLRGVSHIASLSENQNVACGEALVAFHHAINTSPITYNVKCEFVMDALKNEVLNIYQVLQRGTPALKEQQQATLHLRMLNDEGVFPYSDVSRGCAKGYSKKDDYSRVDSTVRPISTAINVFAFVMGAAGLGTARYGEEGCHLVLKDHAKNRAVFFPGDSYNSALAANRITKDRVLGTPVDANIFKIQSLPTSPANYVGIIGERFGRAKYSGLCSTYQYLHQDVLAALVLLTKMGSFGAPTDQQLSQLIDYEDTISQRLKSTPWEEVVSLFLTQKAEEIAQNRLEQPFPAPTFDKKGKPYSEAMVMGGITIQDVERVIVPTEEMKRTVKSKYSTLDVRTVAELKMATTSNTQIRAKL